MGDLPQSQVSKEEEVRERSHIQPRGEAGQGEVPTKTRGWTHGVWSQEEEGGQVQSRGPCRPSTPPLLILALSTELL